MLSQLESEERVAYAEVSCVGRESTNESVIPSDVRSLTFEIDPLDSPIELTGTGEVTLRLEASVPDPTIIVRLIDVSPNSRGTLVSYGALRANTEKASTTLMKWNPELNTI